MKIAIVGPAGAGKSTISKVFEKTGFAVIECDKVVHEAYENNVEIRDWLREYCNNVFISDSIVDRKLLGKILFNSPYLKRKLEDMLHEFVFVPLIEKLKDNYVIDGVMPRFVKEGYDQVIYIHVPENERRRRLRHRGVSEERISDIMVAQYDLFRDPINWK